MSKASDNPTKVTITSGIFRGSVLKTPGGSTHPMGSREKLALFNMVGSERLQGTEVLDAYAGSGALGFEALSRGASKAVFVEKDRASAKIIRENAVSLKVLDRIQIVHLPVTLYCESWRPEHGLRGFDDLITMEKFDLILADPPYDNFIPEEIDDLSFLLKQGGMLVLSHPDEPPYFPWISLLKTHTYAKAHISLYVKDTNYKPHGINI